MHRIELDTRPPATPAAAEPQKKQVSEVAAARAPQFQEFLGTGLLAPSPGEFSLYVPLHYEPRYAYPLIVWLHDNGLSESDVVDAIARMSLRNYVAVGPRGTEQCIDRGYGWSQSRQAIDATESAVVAAIMGACRQLHINRERVFLAGRGHGGTMAFRIGFRHPELFAGVVSVNGAVPEGLAPLANLRRCRRLPLFWTHAARQPGFGEAQLAEQLKLIYTAGFDLTLRQYPDDDACRDLMLADANRWLMEHVSDAVVT